MMSRIRIRIKVVWIRNTAFKYVPIYQLPVPVPVPGSTLFMYTWRHRLFNYIDTKAKWRHKKKLTCTGTLRQVFIRVYRLGYSQSCWYFRPSFVNCCLSNLLFGFILPPPLFPVWISILYTVRVYSVQGGGGYGVLGLRQINTCRKVPLQVIFFRWRHFALPSMSL